LTTQNSRSHSAPIDTSSSGGVLEYIVLLALVRLGPEGDATLERLEAKGFVSSTVGEPSSGRRAKSIASRRGASSSTS